MVLLIRPTGHVSAVGYVNCQAFLSVFNERAAVV